MQQKLLFVTGDTMSPRTLDFLKSSRLPYLAKPFLVDELKEAVRQAVAGTASEAIAAGAELLECGCEGKMNFTGQTIFIISADPEVAHDCIDELSVFGGRYRPLVASSIEAARKRLHRARPAVIFLDESAIGRSRGAESIESAVTLLIQSAPVVVAAAPERQGHLEFLIESGAVDFVERTNQFLSIVAAMLDRRARIAERMAGPIQFPISGELQGDFGEILRHEVNNPLTGILGNTELLLARREGLPPGAVERLQTIAELAVRLRETVRRLSNSWDEHHEPARPA